MLAAWPEMAEPVLRTMMARREWHAEHGYGVLRLIAARGSRRAFEVRDLLERNLVPVRWYDVDTDPESAAMLDWLQIPREETPLLVRNTAVLRNPRPRRSPASSACVPRSTASGSTWSCSAAAPPGSRPRCTAGPRGCARSWPRRGRPADRPAPARGSRTTSASPPGSPAASWRARRRSRRCRFDAVLSSFHRAVELARGPEGLVRIDLDDGQHALARTVVVATGARWRTLSARQRRALHRRRCVLRGHGLRRRAMPRRGRDRGRRRQLRRAGGGVPVAHCAERPCRHPRRRPGIDDVPLPARAHRVPPQHRGHGPYGGQRGPRERPPRVRRAARPRRRERRARRDARLCS